MKPQYMARALRFGRFLAFTPDGRKPGNLCERLFRSFWERADKAGGNERRVRPTRAEISQ